MSTPLFRSLPRDGNMAVLLSFVLVLFVLFSAFSIEMARMQLFRTEIRVATDSAVVASTRTLAIHGSPLDAIDVAKEYASKNTVANQPLLLDTNDIEFGESQIVGDRFEFSPGGQVNSVRITGRKTADSPSGAAPLILGPLLGRSDFATVARSVATQSDRELVLVLDASGSMAWGVNQTAYSTYVPLGAPSDWSYGDPASSASRWFALTLAVDDFLDTLSSTAQSERVALVIFKGESSFEVPLTTNYNSIRAAMNLHTNAYTEGRTNIAAGINDGNTALLRSVCRKYASRTMIVMTDGINNEGDPLANTSIANANGITINTVTFSNEADQYGMRLVADAGGGIHLHATTSTALREAFRRLALATPTLITE